MAAGVRKVRAGNLSPSLYVLRLLMIDLGMDDPASGTVVDV